MKKAPIRSTHRRLQSASPERHVIPIPIGNVRRQVILPGKRRPGEITQIERLHLRRLGMPVLQCFLSGLYRERTEIAIRERAKGGLPDADYGYCSHTFRIARSLRIRDRKKRFQRLLDGTTVGPGLR